MRKITYYSYLFTYRSISGFLRTTTIKVKQRENELAIAQFEKLYPDEVWLQFEEAPASKLQS